MNEDGAAQKVEIFQALAEGLLSVHTAWFEVEELGCQSQRTRREVLSGQMYN